MKDVSVISPLPVQAPDPETEGSMDELQDALVPAQEDELPQGVLELVAALIFRHRPVMETLRGPVLQSMDTAQGASDIKFDEVRPMASARLFHPQVSPVLSKQMHQPLAPSIALAAPSGDRVTTPAHLTPRSVITVESKLIERPSNRVQPVLTVRASNAVDPTLTERPSNAIDPMLTVRAPNTVEPLPVDLPDAPVIDAQLPEVLLSPQAPRSTPLVAQPSIPMPVMLRTPPAPAVMPETLPGTERGLLQVPFNKGEANGQVTITRVADEPSRSLLLSPSNALVFDQLRSHFELSREPSWQLTDHDSEQQHQGSRQLPDEEAAEEPDLPA